MQCSILDNVDQVIFFEAKTKRELDKIFSLNDFFLMVGGKNNCSVNYRKLFLCLHEDFFSAQGTWILHENFFGTGDRLFQVNKKMSKGGVHHNFCNSSALANPYQFPLKIWVSFCDRLKLHFSKLSIKTISKKSVFFCVVSDSKKY